MKQNVLVVVDMQKDFIDGSLGTKEAQAIVPAAIRKIEGWNGPIFVTLDTHDADYLKTSEGMKLPVEHCIKGTDGWKLDERIAQALSGKDYQLVEKPTFGSIRLPSLIEEKTQGQIEAIEFIGLCTDICVVSNVLAVKAHFHETPIRVDAACCAGVTVEKHEAALLTMESCQIDILNKEAQ